jgi:Protein of unknown function (DUF3099)
VEGVRSVRSPRRDQAHLVTEARPGLSQDIAYRERRYLIMMGIRTVCFVTAILMFVNHLGWLTAIPVVGALVIPYFAVVFANGGREPTSSGKFRQYEPNSPAMYRPPGSDDFPDGAHPRRSNGAQSPSSAPPGQ